MTDDACTAYICIYCPFNCSNLQALEEHLTSAHGYGCQDAPQLQAATNVITKTNKREAPDDEQSPSTLEDPGQTTAFSTGVKRLKRAVSPVITDPFGHSSDDPTESDEDDDERDSALHSSAMLPNTLLTCPICGSMYESLDHLVRHAKRKHGMDLSNYDQSHSLDTLPDADFEKSDFDTPQMEVHLPVSAAETNIDSTNTTTDCPYCDFKTTDIEQFKAHIVAHIRDKNYRCLLCNRLYKYRGDCSFHIRRKHHRFSVNANDYIQRFLFDTTDGDESTSAQGSSSNGLGSHTNAARESDEPVRYFGCPYCDYTSNYGGDVRKHQARKHPNAEPKVVKIVRQDAEQQQLNGIDEDDEDDSANAHLHSISKTKSSKKSDKNLQPLQASPTPVLSNFAPVRVFQCSSCHQQGTYKWVVERHIRAKHPDQANAHVIELPAELSVRLQKISPPLKRFRCSLCPLQSTHSWVVIRHIKHFHTLQTATVIDIQPDGKPISDDLGALSSSDLPSKVDNPDSESSSVSSSCMDNGMDFAQQQDLDDDIPSSFSTTNHNDPMAFTYKCSLCEYQSNISCDIQKHINEKHTGQSNAYMLTQCQQAKPPTNDNDQQKSNSTKKTKQKNGIHRPLSPSSALAKAKFSPAVEEALLSLQGSKLNPNLYAVQPKFGIKRLKCRHCFYRSNWKTDMIRHVRIRHNLTEPDHNKDMIMMTEQEARSTIELYENTFGKELRRRTFRTWNDWAKAEQEFTPKDGSLQYVETNGGQPGKDHVRSLAKKPIEQKALHSDVVKRSNKPTIKTECQQESSQLMKTLLFNKSIPSVKKEELKPLPNPSNIVSRLFSTPSSGHDNDDDSPLDLSLKPSTPAISQLYPTAETADDDADQSDEEEEEFDQSSTVSYLCSVCPYKHSSWSVVQRHISLHLTGQGITCPLCSYATSSRPSMHRHIATLHPTSQMKANFQASSPNLAAHIIEQHQCSLCPYQCDRAEALNLHRRLEHDDEEFDIDSSDNDDEMTASTTKNLFECPLCSPSLSTNNFTDLEQLTLHVINNHHNQSCPFCSFIAHTTSSQTLLQHVKLHFNGTLVQPDSMVGVEQVKELLMLE